MKSAHRAPPVLSIWALIILAVAAVAAAAEQADEITVIDPYVRAVPPVVKNSAAFMQFRNQGASEYFLVDAVSPIAGAVELHMHSAAGGMMQMRRVPHIHLPPGQLVTLEPGQEHIMLFDLAEPLRPGDRVPITLRFSDGSSQQISAEVRRADGEN